ncbi:threonine--tRNA ligase [Candidatus Giovannonibacteria bacterium]|nr:threonine--tRNA ligase [Candidatus Giovannonibacteria bacterium]
MKNSNGVLKQKKSHELLNPQKKLGNTRHSLAHLLAAAVLKKFPNAKLGIGPAIETGFYYDFLLPRQLTSGDLKDFEETMRTMILECLRFTGKKVTPVLAKKLFKDQKFKLELISDFTKEKKPLTVYSTGNIFMDLCRGGHVKNTSEINPDAFRLTHIAGAYWKGNEKNPQLTRIYGVAFDSKKELEDYLMKQEEAKKRDHRRLGKDLSLFAIADEIGPGLPLFYPKGAILRRTVENFIQDLQEKNGYEPIWIPHITKGELYKISGHLDKYDAMYPPMKLKGEAEYYLKPMNCPHFMMLYRTRAHSYRELPIRWTATTTVYRLEKSGELSGLTRVRSLTQDDCHVFAKADQIENEINLMLDMLEKVYGAFGFNDFRVHISTHDPKDIKKYIGERKIWKQSEKILENLIQKRSWSFEIVPGEAAFYGPKLDFIFKDVLGREWQLSTIQLDMNLPKRFELEYTDENGKRKEPIVIHRAILGSTERFLGIIVEHFAGAFPFWLAPVQVSILTINEKTFPFAKGIERELRKSEIRVEIDSRNETIGKKIREAEMQKVPFILIIGDKEVAANKVAVRERGKGDLGQKTLEEFLKIAK